MADITIPAGQYAIVTFTGRGQDGSAQNLEDGTATATTSDNSRVYVARTSGPHVQPYSIAVVPKVQPNIGGSYQVSLTFNGNDGASGIALPTLTQTVQVNGPAPQPQAAFNLQFTAVTFDDLVNAPDDPGTATINL